MSASAAPSSPSHHTQPAAHMRPGNGITLQPQGPSQASGAPFVPRGPVQSVAQPTPSSTSPPSSPSPTQTTSSAASPQTSNNTSPTIVVSPHTSQSQGAPIKQTAPTPTGTIRKWAPLIRAFGFYLAVLCIYIFVCLIAIKGNSTDWVLTHLNPTSGILLLSFLSKMIDWGLAGSTNKTWTMLQWGPILRGGRGREKNMLIFLTLGARLDGCVKVLFSRCAWTWSKIVNCAALWALLKLIVLILVQFPGLIIMAVVEPQTKYLAERFTPVSGGIGVFDPSAITQQFQGPAIANYVYTILEDPRFTFRADDAVTPECHSASSCQSYLMTGGLTTMSPLPYRQAGDERLTAFVAKNVPSYQLDAWDMSSKPVNFTFGDCQLYTIPDEGSLGFHLCMKDEPDGAVLAGYAPCYSFDGPGSCQTNATSSTVIQLTAWVTKISIYRVKATFTTNRRSGIILSTDNSPSNDGTPPPTLQTIPSSSLRRAINNLVCPASSSNTKTEQPESSACPRFGPNFLLTDSISQLLGTSITLEYSPAAQAVLQNLIATSLFLFTPVWIIQLGVNLVERGGIVSGLPAENYFEGAMARPVSFVAPAKWTVVAFMVGGGLLMVFCVVGMVYSVASLSRGGGVGVGEVSSFGLVDSGWLEVKDGQGVVKGFGDFLGHVGGRDVSDEDVVKAAREMEIRAR